MRWPDGVVGYHVSLTGFSRHSDKVLSSILSLVILLLHFSHLEWMQSKRCCGSV